jgi:serine/threonine-protein kinase
VLPPAGATRVLATADLAPAAPRRGQPTDVVDRLRLATAKAHRRGAWAFAAVLVVGAMSAGTGWYYGGGPGSTSSVPSLKGMTEDSATTALRAQHFRVGTTSTVWSTVAEGTVTGTSPSAGTQQVQGTVVTLHLSGGEQPAAAPTVKGSTVAEATARITAARLTLAGQVERTSSKTAGTVLKLVDADGATVEPGTTLDAETAVRIWVSKGPAAPPSSPTPTGSSTAPAG